MQTLKILHLADHLLEKTKTEDEEIKKEIELLRCEVKAGIHFILQGHDIAGKLQLSKVGPKIDELITKIGEKDTIPCPAPDPEADE